MREMLGVGCMTLWLICTSIQDIRRRRVSLVMLVVGAGIGLWLAIEGCKQGWSVLHMAAGLLPGVMFWWLGYITRCVGSADGIVLALIGVGLGWKRALVIWLLSLLLIGIGAMAYVIWKRGSRKKKLPYIPFLSVAWILYFVCGGR